MSAPRVEARPAKLRDAPFQHRRKALEQIGLGFRVRHSADERSVSCIIQCMLRVLGFIVYGVRPKQVSVKEEASSKVAIVLCYEPRRVSGVYAFCLLQKVIHVGVVAHLSGFSYVFSKR